MSEYQQGDIGKVEFYAERENFGVQIALHIRQYRLDRFCVPAPLVWRDVAEGEILPPALSMRMASAQQLMDELWRCGLRPSEGTGSAGSLAATERHLKDMREIAFGQLSMKAP